ncbi:hypothetical protein TIFTF001_033498 [Ficus carica]|uniref:Uncharacterized protein n=1 Tax=Ficus carica TaxID=3494 RepID=A0AA88E0T0_FICCA|nr:hypothetical protein TIFTF001_033498 [Ficus carica]
MKFLRWLLLSIEFRRGHDREVDDDLDLCASKSTRSSWGSPQDLTLYISPALEPWVLIVQSAKAPLGCRWRWRPSFRRGIFGFSHGYLL